VALGLILLINLLAVAVLSLGVFFGNKKPKNEAVPLYHCGLLLARPLARAGRLRFLAHHVGSRKRSDGDGMSDEAEQRWWWWLWWGAAILAVYVLSIGPAWRWALSAGSLTETGQRIRAMYTIYAPIYWLNDNFDRTGHGMDWYKSKWEPEPEKPICILRLPRTSPAKLPCQSPKTVIHARSRAHAVILADAPAMAAGVIDRLWGMDDLYNAVTEHAAKERAKAKRER
jgi:hypothetical protein